MSSASRERAIAPPAATRSPSRRLRTFALRVLPVAAYATLAAIVFAKQGIPLSEDRALAWLLGGLACLSLANVGRFGRGLLLEWLPLAAALTLYDVSRGVGGGRVPIHALAQIRADRWLTGTGQVPTVWLQRRLWNPLHLHWWDYAVWATYMSYFLVTPLVLGFLWLRDNRRFRRYALLLTLVSFSALAVFLASPTTPPWLASEHGLIGPVTRAAWQIGNHVPVFDDTTLYERGVRLETDLASFPSLHEAMTLLLSLFFWPTAGRRLRALLVLYPLAMAFALVYAGEHYLVDLLGGALLATAVVVAVERAERAALRRRQRDRRAPAPVRVLDALLAHTRPRSL